MSKIVYKPGPYLADEYLALKAEQANLALREKAIKDALLRMGVEELEGEFARVSISEVAGRSSYDAKALEQIFPKSQLDMCRKVGSPSLRFSVSARKAVA